MLALVLVGSSLMLRRVGSGNLLKLILFWALIFGLVWVGAQYYTVCCAGPR
jgi:hypothetical protein